MPRSGDRPGTPETHDMGEGANIVTDIPRYRVYENRVFTKELTDASAYWKEGYTGFLIGCSFSFEEALMEAGIQVRHIAQGRNVPMYKTNIETVKAGPFEGPMVCSMRPMTPENAQKAYAITEKMPNVHGAPVHMGDGAEIGIRDIMKPDYGDAVDLYEGEIPVFWPCGVTPRQRWSMQSRRWSLPMRPDICLSRILKILSSTDTWRHGRGRRSKTGKTLIFRLDFEKKWLTHPEEYNIMYNCDIG